MADNNIKFMNLLRSWTTFWVMIVTMIITFTIAFTTLQNKVYAIENRNIKREAEIKDTNELLLEVRDSVIRMEKDIEYIKEKVN